MKPNLNIFKNGRRPELFRNGRWPQFFSKWKTTAKPKLILGLAQLSKILDDILRLNSSLQFDLNTYLYWTNCDRVSATSQIGGNLLSQCWRVILNPCAVYNTHICHPLCLLNLGPDKRSLDIGSEGPRGLELSRVIPRGLNTQ